MNDCNELDLPDSPDDLVEKYTINLHNIPSSLYTGPVRLTWFTTTKGARESFTSLRLVCRQFRAASWEGFGCILADRRFRLTKADIDELGNIGAEDDLAEWIKTLTFATAQPHDEVTWDVEDRRRHGEETIQLIKAIKKGYSEE